MTATFHNAFAVQDADTDLQAQLIQMDDQIDMANTSIVITDKTHDRSIIISIADFRRMAAALDQAIDRHVA